MLEKRDVLQVYPWQVLRINITEVPIVRPSLISVQKVAEPSFKYSLTGSYKYRVDGGIWPQLRQIALMSKTWSMTEINIIAREDPVIFWVGAYLWPQPFGVFLPRQWKEVDPDESFGISDLVRRNTVRLWTIEG
ncbi:MAG: hypothetical protein WCT01_00940 [Candidatus Shapirobacteria bacterium]